MTAPTAHHMHGNDLPSFPPRGSPRGSAPGTDASLPPSVPLPPFREMFGEAVKTAPGLRHEGWTAARLERALATLPLEEQADAALDAVEGQAARMVAWHAWLIEIAVGRERCEEADHVRLSSLGETTSMEITTLVKERDRAVDALLKLRERRQKIAHLCNVNQRGERVLRLVPDAVLPPGSPGTESEDAMGARTAAE